MKYEKYKEERHHWSVWIVRDPHDHEINETFKLPGRQYAMELGSVLKAAGYLVEVAEWREKRTSRFYRKVHDLK